MTSYATKSSYEFTDTPKNTPQKAPKPDTPSAADTPSKSGALSSFFSSKWGSITAKASEVAQKARGRLNEIVQSNPSTPLNVSQESIDWAFAPWENLCAQDPNIENEVRQLILDITNNPRHLLNAPPEGDASFQLDDWLPVALVALKKDSKLRHARTSLVPSEIDEDGFWRNYFFRVNLLKRAFNLPEQPQLKDSAPTAKPTNLRDMLSSSGSSLGKPEPIDFSDAIPLSPPLKEDEPNINGLIEMTETVTSENDAISLASVTSSSNTTESLQHSHRRDSMDIDGTGAWQVHYEFGDIAQINSKTPVPDEILKALED